MDIDEALAVLRALVESRGHPEAHTALAEVEQLRAAVARVRGLHRTETDYCPACGEDYPCPTVRALDGEA